MVLNFKITFQLQANQLNQQLIQRLQKSEQIFFYKFKTIITYQREMQQAYNHFNSGKYKQAYNFLASSNLNIDSYEPNLAICEYLANRCLQTSINCHKKLNDWLIKKLKRENYKLDCHTESIVKFNIAILLILLGKRDNALLVMTDIYKNRACFIEYMQSRIMLLLMEMNITLRNPTTVLSIYRKYPIRPSDCRNQSSQWISLIMHEHNKSSTVCKQQFYFLARILLNQSLMQLSFPETSLTTKQSDKELKDLLVQRIKKRKNTINKFYQINILMISRFHQAQKELYKGNNVKCLELMNFANIQNQIEQLPSTKIIANILNALTTSNTGIVHFWQKKYHVALQYFLKAKSLLSKGITGVEDKDLQLFWINYSSHSEAISYNMALSLLAAKSKQAYLMFEAMKKCNSNIQYFKWWYRAGQALLQNYHQLNRKKTDPARLTQLLEQAQQCFYCALSLLEKNRFPDQNDVLKKIVSEITEEQILVAQMKFNAEKRDFRRSIITILCYVYNCLGKYNETIKLAQSILSQDLKKTDRLNILHYSMEAYILLCREKEQQEIFKQLKKQSQSIKEVKTPVIYSNQPYSKQILNYEDLFIYQTAIWYIKNEQTLEASSLIQNLRVKAGLYPSPVLKILFRYLHIQIGLDKKFVEPYLK